MRLFALNVKASSLLVGQVAGLLLAQSALGGTATSTTAYEYDPASGRLAAVVREPDNPQLHLRSAYAYDNFGNRLTTTVSSQATGTAAVATRVVETRTYDIYGIAPTSTTNAIGQKVQAGIDPTNLPLYVQALNGTLTTWKYDQFGRKTKELRPDGTYTTWSYYETCNGSDSFCNGAQSFIEEQSYGSNSFEVRPWVRTYFDGLERKTRTRTPGFDGVSIITQDTEYDAVTGNVSRVSRPYYPGAAIKWTTYQYDSLGRTVLTTNPDGSTTSTSYQGLTTVATNTLGQTRTTIVNGKGQLVQVIDAQGNALSYAYDANGKLLSTTDPKGNVVTMAYDALGRKTSMVDPDMGTFGYE